MGYNVVLVTENDTVTRASLGNGVFVDGNQSTEIHDNDTSAAQALLAYEEEGAHVPSRDKKEAQKILGL